MTTFSRAATIYIITIYIITIYIITIYIITIYIITIYIITIYWNSYVTIMMPDGPFSVNCIL